jgi:hypothetical protein
MDLQVLNYQPSSTVQSRVEFIKASTWHGTLDRAEAMLAAHPELASSDIHIAAILGDEVAVRQFLADDPASVNAKSEPYGADALTHLIGPGYAQLDLAISRNLSFGSTRLELRAELSDAVGRLHPIGAGSRECSRSRCTSGTP